MFNGMNVCTRSTETSFNPDASNSNGDSGARCTENCSEHKSIKPNQKKGQSTISIIDR